MTEGGGGGRLRVIGVKGMMFSSELQRERERGGGGTGNDELV